MRQRRCENGEYSDIFTVINRSSHQEDIKTPNVYAIDNELENT